MRVLKVAARLLWVWLTSSALPRRERWAYIKALIGYAIRPKAREIVYLGAPFHFDSWKAPMVLMIFPRDIIGGMLGQISTPLRSVLDIGGNIGQFARTLLYACPDIEQLDVFEPNPTVLGYLQQNLEGYSQVSVFPLGVGEAGERTLYYVPQASATGSLIPNRASHVGTTTSRGSEAEVSVKVVSDVAERTGRGLYDLVKVDVEGAEFEVLSHLEVRMTYLWLELSGRKFRGGTFRTSDLFDLLRERFGAFDVLYQSAWDQTDVCDILLEFAPSESPAP